MPRLLQICNVGRIVGGTGACAWTVTRALPEFEHHVVFLTPPDRETVEAFDPIPVSHASMITSHMTGVFCPDVILLHNTSARRLCGKSSVPSVLYLHSAIPEPAAADVTVCCSQWLARRMEMSSDQVLWQAVPESAPRCLAANPKQSRMIVGRICTPQLRKWPRTIVPFYSHLASRVPNIVWEFVGCPLDLQPALAGACGGRIAFHPAGWRQRTLLSRWDVLLYSNPAVQESFGRTAAEAMRAGCIPVVDRLGGFIEQIPDDCGFLCESLDGFAAALERLSDLEIRRRMSKQAVDHANTHFSLPRFARDLQTWFDLAAQAHS